MPTRNTLLGTLILFLVAPTALWGLGEESFGNNRVNGYEDRAGIGEVINQKTRVYRRWVNGNEHFFFRGDTKQLNIALRNFAKMETKVREIVLRPGPGIGHSFGKKKAIPHNWQLHIIGGIASRMTNSDKGELIWSAWPVLTVYVGGTIRLEEIDLPKGIVLSELSDLSRRYRRAIATSSDRTVRGWGTGELARLSPYDAENLAVVAKMLSDRDNWVRVNAAGALPEFGAAAKKHLPALRKCLESDDAQLKSYADKAIQQIEKAKPNPAAEQSFATTRSAIQRICKMRPKRKTEGG